MQHKIHQVANIRSRTIQSVKIFPTDFLSMLISRN